MFPLHMKYLFQASVLRSVIRPAGNHYLTCVYPGVLRWDSGWVSGTQCGCAGVTMHFQLFVPLSRSLDSSPLAGFAA